MPVDPEPPEETNMDPEDDLFKILGEPEQTAAKESSPAPQPSLGTRLRDFLAQRYGQPTSPSARHPTHVQPISIDDRDAGDVYEWFCDVSVRIPDNRDGQFLLQLIHPPCNAEVEDLVKAKGGRVRQLTAKPSWGPYSFRIPVRPKDGPYLRKLARAIRHVISGRPSYPDRNWLWLAPRTAKSLELLAHHLDDFRKSAKR
jgi:hypothetical protein